MLLNRFNTKAKVMSIDWEGDGYSPGNRKPTESHRMVILDLAGAQQALKDSPIQKGDIVEYDNEVYKVQRLVFSGEVKAYIGNNPVKISKLNKIDPTPKIELKFGTAITPD